MAKDKTVMEDLLFKPLVARDSNDEERLIIIFGNDTTTKNSLNPSGKKTKEVANVIHVLDITATIALGQAAIESSVVNNFSKFKSRLKEIKAEDCEEELHIATRVL